MNELAFISLTDQGKNAPWRYVLGTILIVVFWVGGTSLMISPVVVFEVVPKHSPLAFALELLSFGAMLLGVMLVTRLLHARSPSTLFGVARRLNWRVILLAALVWAALTALASGVSFALDSRRFVVNDKLLEHIPILLIGLALIPLQTSAEEVFFRGYLLQATGRVVRHPVLLSVLNGVLFTLPHLDNPEAQANLWLAAVQWFLAGFMPALLTLRHGTLDAALGIHAANNLYSFALVGYRVGEGESVLPTVALVTETSYDFVFYAVAAVVSSVIAYLALVRARPTADRALPRAVAAR